MQMPLPVPVLVKRWSGMLYTTGNTVAAVAVIVAIRIVIVMWVSFSVAHCVAQLHGLEEV